MSNDNHQSKRIYDPNINAYNKLNGIATLTAPYSYQTYAIPNVNECNESIIATPISSMSFTAAVSYSNAILTETAVYSINTSVPMLSICSVSISSAHTD
eukprot:204789_1